MAWVTVLVVLLVHPSSILRFLIVLVTVVILPFLGNSRCVRCVLVLSFLTHTLLVRRNGFAPLKGNGNVSKKEHGTHGLPQN
jgi:hypothetical protein